MDGVVKEIGVVEEGEVKDKTHQHSNTARLVGKRGNIQGKGQTTIYGYPRLGA
jgi:hypothetical protein